MTATERQQMRPNYGIIAILLAGAFVSILNSTLLNVALPSMMADFKVEPTTIQWLATGYMLINGIIIPSTAFLIQKFSVRHLFITAMILFTIGTIFSGFAPSFALLLVGRMIQAAGSAIMMPLLMNVLLTSFPIEKRGGAMGILGLVMIFAPAIGPTLSGWIIEHYEWRYLFYMIIPFAVIVLLLSIFKLKDKKEKSNASLDVLSVIFSSVGFGGLLYGFSSAGSKGWDDVEVFGTLIAGVIGLILLIVRQFQLEKPMLDFRVYKYPMFSLSSAISIVLNMAMFSAMILMPIYLQNIRGISPLDSGLLMLPGAIIMGIMSPITGKLFDKFGGRILAIIGLTITVATTYFFSQLTTETTYGTLIVMYSVRMFGMSMVMMPIMTNGMNSLPARLNPHGTAMNSTLNQVSGAIGSALLVSVMTSRTKIHAEELAEKAMSKLTGQPSPEEIAQLEAQIYTQATVDGINDAFFIATFIAVLALILAFFVKRPKRADEQINLQKTQDLSQ
ncbi:DHA2 family efflux MFS transporter permease subunit [Pradoshia sp. D12]|uniref:DHA2 family efflux MFS transporter permease subunit n=1 Tax=Bacillaceae TaxID=186817 RepID=UPI00080AD834|nr:MULTISPECIES: DHA2 family efflux MFS transporter permease subunit [Bacillaceae]OCA82554.1 MFS transporter [Bacillus sp. FJAT-27986]QFK70236.1 DHA2 family efflux MFS transporter permease subunit [Pradoshia sp. D12]TPF71016.1 DHA2 family efflux MFS transporter permease subunit [Bacillus sp. D12]